MPTSPPAKTYLFVGGPADGRRIELDVSVREWLVPEYEPATGSALEVLMTEDFAKMKPLKNHRYERKYLSFGVSGEEILQVFGLAGVPVREVLSELIARYPKA